MADPLLLPGRGGFVGDGLLNFLQHTLPKSLGISICQGVLGGFYLEVSINVAIPIAGLFTSTVVFHGKSIYKWMMTGGTPIGPCTPPFHQESRSLPEEASLTSGAWHCRFALDPKFAVRQRAQRKLCGAIGLLPKGHDLNIP